MKVFVDSDVVISSLLSKSGAAHALFDHPNITPVISTYSKKEIEIVIKRLNINSYDFEVKLAKKLEIINMQDNLSEIKKQFVDYILDINDAHIVTGARKSTAKFLVTYNVRHFVVERIRNDFKIVILTPGQFLQYLRSRT